MPVIIQITAIYVRGHPSKDVRTKRRPHQRGQGSVKCRRYYQFVPVKGQNMRTQGEGAQISVKFCGRPLWMAPYINCIYVAISCCLIIVVNCTTPCTTVEYA